jgi:deoxyadenosine/deoxycytidine kinase
VHIIVSGPIGVGKTTLIHRLAPALGLQPLVEDYKRNPFLERFYRAPADWAAASQYSFLRSTLRQHAEACSQGGVQESSFYDVHYVFNKVIHRSGLLSDAQFADFDEIVTEASTELPPPTVVVQLSAKTEVLISRIARRGRVSERAITPGYLNELEEFRELWWSHWTESAVVAFDTAARDVRTGAGLAYLLELVIAAVPGIAGRPPTVSRRAQ